MTAHTKTLCPGKAVKEHRGHTVRTQWTDCRGSRWLHAGQHEHQNNDKEVKNKVKIHKSLLRQMHEWKIRGSAFFVEVN